MTSLTPETCDTLTRVLRYRTDADPDRQCLEFLSSSESTTLTYAELDARARSTAVFIREHAKPGDRVLLVHPPGLDYIAHFFGCLYAGVIAVPALPPRMNHHMTRIETIVRDIDAAMALTTDTVLTAMKPLLEAAPGLSDLQWYTGETAEAADPELWKMPDINGDSLAFLQYTSGSTSLPKGVMLSHTNLLHNLRVIGAAFQVDHERDSSAFWLPPHHDMGLIGGVLEPIYNAIPATLMSPVSFLQKPFRWLEVLSDLKATVSGAPNFAYEMCVERVNEEQVASLDLSNWQLAFSGAEPVRAETLELFAKKFAPSGFNARAFYPCYGLAEATLFISGEARNEHAVVLNVERDALSRGEVITSESDAPGTQALVSAGLPSPGHRIVIAEPDTGKPLEANQIGEIWVKSDSVAGGYWEREKETKETFGNRVKGEEGDFLRSGDLGFIRDGRLFIAGRLKDLIIINGVNHYPQDIELTAAASHDALPRDVGAAFAMDIDGEERLVLVQEIDRKHRKAGEEQLREIIKALRAAISENHALRTAAIAILKPGSVPKTTSGKIQRRACRTKYRNGEFEILMEWTEKGDLTADMNVASQDDAARDRDAAIMTPAVREMEAFLIKNLALRLKLNPNHVDPEEPFAVYGLDSAGAVSLVGELGEMLKRELSPTLMYEHPSIRALALHLAGQADVAGAMPPAAKSAGMTGGTMRGDNREPIAVIGMGCRFPGADSPEAFWKMLGEGVDAVMEVPEDRWNADELYDPDPGKPGHMNTRWGGFLKDIDLFDADFFGIAPREAARMDPQQRLLLTTAWEALEDAGIPHKDLAGSRTGVFVGISSGDYGRTRFNDAQDINDAFAATGNAYSIAANRLSYFFDFRGPSIALDTACSSSLASLLLAVRSLRAGESDIALAGGVNVLLSPLVTMNFSRGNFMSPTGRCKAFAADADGYVRGEGAGLVVLKPLSKAEADGDEIYAVIRGGAMNQDGRSNGLTAPNPAAQEAVLRDACADAGVDPGHVNYVEAHGTGTPLGDPIEAGALGRVYGRAPGRESVCRLGSVKTNIGHLESGAGIAGFIKTAKLLESGHIPRSLHYVNSNPRIDFQALGLEVACEASDLPEQEGGSIAGVSSFGFGGTNVHLILSRAPAKANLESETQSPARLEAPALLLSSRSPEGLRGEANVLLNHLENVSVEEYRELTAALALRRSHLEHRLALSAAGPEEARESLRNYLRGETDDARAEGRMLRERAAGPVFVFAGQGAQWEGMGRDSMKQSPVFREAVLACDAIFQELGGPAVATLLADGDQPLDDTAVAQACIFTLQVGLMAQWRSLGILPGAVIGHSVGEVAAAHAAGILDLKDAVKVVHHRGRLMRAARGSGRMAAVGMPESDAIQLLKKYDGKVHIAAVNSPGNVTFCGDESALNRMGEELGEKGIFFRMLRGEYAFHGPAMEPFRDELRDALKDIRVGPASIACYSTVRGAAAEGGDYDAEYWRENIRRPVLFGAAAAAAGDDGHRVFLEIGPHPVLSPVVEQSVDRVELITGSLYREKDTAMTMSRSMARLHCVGAPVNWRAMYEADSARNGFRRPPRRSWVERRHWVTGTDVTLAGASSVAAMRLPSGEFTRLVEIASGEEANDARPITASILLSEAARTAEEALELSCELRDARLAPVPGRAVLKTVFRPRGPELAGEGRVEVFASVTEVEWTRVLDAEVYLRDERNEAVLTPDTLGSYFTETLEPESYQGGAGQSPTFKALRNVRVRGNELLAELDGDMVFENSHSAATSAVLETALVLFSALGEDRESEPVRADRVMIRNVAGGGPLLLHLRLNASGLEGEAGRDELRILDEHGRVLADLRGMERPPMGAGNVIYDILEREENETGAESVRDASPRFRIIFGDADELLGELTAELETMGSEVVVVRPGDGFHADAGREFRINEDQASDYEELFTELSRRDFLRDADILYLPSIEKEPAAATLAFARLLRVLVRRDDAPILRLSTEEANPVHGALRGLAHTASNEHSGLDIRILAVRDDNDADFRLQAILNLEAGEPTLLKDNSRRVFRLRKRAAHEGVPVPRTVRDDEGVRIEQPGLARAFRRTVPPAGHVEIETQAAGLCSTSGHGRECAAFALECTGTVIAAGEGVTQFKPGDRVAALSPEAAATHVVVPARLVVAIPAEGEAWDYLRLDELWAAYALEHLARPARGEFVLVDAAESSRGRALTERALAMGARVIAISREGASESNQVGDSEEVQRPTGLITLEGNRPGLARELHRLTEGKGLDVIILPAAGVNPELRDALAAFGRVVLDNGLPFPVEGANVSRFAFDIQELIQGRPELTGELYAEVHERAAGIPIEGEIVSPDRIASLSRKHRPGKFILEFDEASRERAPGPVFDGRFGPGTYLITGGLGALGLSLAEWMVSRGAEHLVLVSRSEPRPEVEKRLESMRAAGARIQLRSADISNGADTAALLREIRGEGPALRGVFHAAGVLRDGLFMNQSDEHFLEVTGAKFGAGHLHRETAEDNLDHFVLFSSIAALLGNPGQSNYAAGNAYLDALALERARAGLPALSVNWGPWAGEGMAANTPMSVAGLAPLSLNQAFAALELALKAGSPRACIANFQTHAANSPLRALPICEDLFGGETTALTGALRSRIAAAKPEERGDLLLSHAVSRLAAVLRLPAERLDVSRPLNTLGLDSVLAMEFRSRLETELGTNIPVAELIRGPSLEELCERILPSLRGAESSDPSDSPPENESDEGARVHGESPFTSLVERDSAKLGGDPWLRRFSPPGDVEMRLFCFPYGGSGASIFREWATRFDSRIELIGVQLPGREDRIREAPMNDIDEITDALIQSIYSHLDRPFAFYGHSIGSFLAYELARELHRRGLPSPFHLFVGAYRAPHLPIPPVRIADLSDEEFLEEVRRFEGTPPAILENQELMRLLLPTLRADAEIHRNHFRAETNQLQCEISALHGVRDPMITREEMEAWSEQTTGLFRLQRFGGGHFFIHENREWVIRYIHGHLLARSMEVGR